MPLIPSHIFILTHSIASILAAYTLLTSPSRLLSNSFTPVWMLGEAMHVREAASKWTTVPSEPVAALGLLLALSALTQAFFASGLSNVEISMNGKQSKAQVGELGEKVYRLRYAQNQWMGLAGIRVLLMGALVGWTYLFQGQTSSQMANLSRITGVTLLANRAVFSAAMTDMLFWGYLWTNIREEGRELAMAVSRLRVQNEEDELLKS